jgi:hypothetical protein
MTPQIRGFAGYLMAQTKEYDVLADRLEVYLPTIPR